MITSADPLFILILSIIVGLLAFLGSGAVFSFISNQDGTIVTGVLYSIAFSLLMLICIVFYFAMSSAS